MSIINRDKTKIGILDEVKDDLTIEFNDIEENGAGQENFDNAVNAAVKIGMLYPATKELLLDGKFVQEIR